MPRCGRPRVTNEINVMGENQCRSALPVSGEAVNVLSPQLHPACGGLIHILKPFCSQPRTFNKAFLGFLGLSMGSFLTLVAVL